MDELADRRERRMQMPADEDAEFLTLLREIKAIGQDLQAAVAQEPAVTPLPRRWTAASRRLRRAT